MRILIVEDDARMADAVRRGLLSEGMAVDVAASGEEALWRAREDAYAVVVLDVGLPGIDGIETCRRLRSAGGWAPILMLTARGAGKDPGGGVNRGGHD